MENTQVTEFQGDKETAQEFGAFYTPMPLCEKMAGLFQGSIVGKTFLDPTIGYGNLIIAVLNRKVAEGEDPSQALTEVYGIELQPECVNVCLRNLKHWAEEHHAMWDDELMRTHIHQGDALDDKSYIFGDEDFRPSPDMGDFSAFLE